MQKDEWITPDEAKNRLERAGYLTLLGNWTVMYSKRGRYGRFTIHKRGVDGVAVNRICKGECLEPQERSHARET